jgi:hypothetical protein
MSKEVGAFKRLCQEAMVVQLKDGNTVTFTCVASKITMFWSKVGATGKGFLLQSRLGSELRRQAQLKSRGNVPLNPWDDG